MKIFIDGHFLDGRRHGVAKFLDRLYTQYSHINPTDELHIGLEPNQKFKYEFFSGPNVFLHQYKFGGFLRFLLDIPILTRKIKPHVIHTQYVLPLRWGSKCIRHVTIHDVLYEDYPEYFTFFYRWARKIFFRISAKKADLVTTISKYSRSRIAFWYGLNELDIPLIYPGVVDYENEPYVPKRLIRNNSVLYVSRFEKRKNHLTLLNALKIFVKENPGIKLILVGFDVDGTLKVIKEFIRKNKLHDNVEFKTNIPDVDLHKLYNASGAVVYPSYCEGFGMPVVEAFLQNPFTLFSNTTAMAEFPFCKSNSFDPNDVSEILDKLSMALDSRDESPPDWQKHKLLVMKQYNWNRSAQNLSELYHTDNQTPVTVGPTGHSS